MKKNIFAKICVALVLAFMLLFTGCQGLVDMLTEPENTAVPDYIEESGENPEGNKSAFQAGVKIEGFESGMNVPIEEAPGVVTDVKEAYPDAEIKGINYVMYFNDQIYHVIMKRPNMDSEQLVIYPDGTIIPYDVSPWQ